MNQRNRPLSAELQLEIAGEGPVQLPACIANVKKVFPNLCIMQWQLSIIFSSPIMLSDHEM